jgi:hypothetical protein
MVSMPIAHYMDILRNIWVGLGLSRTAFAWRIAAGRIMATVSIAGSKFGDDAKLGVFGHANAYPILVKSPLKGHPWALNKVNLTMKQEPENGRIGGAKIMVD